MMSFHQPLSLFLFLLDGGPWEEGEQMLGEGGGGNVGVHADHHVLNLSSAPPLPTTSVTTTPWQLSLLTRVHHHHHPQTRPPNPTTSVSVHPSLYCFAVFG